MVNYKEQEEKTMYDKLEEKDSVRMNDDKTVKEKIIEYDRGREEKGAIEETHERATFLIDKDLLEKLASLQAHLEITNAYNSELFGTSTISLTRQRRERKLATGFKTKFINTALNDLFKQYEFENGEIPLVQTIRFRYANGQKVENTVKKGAIHRVFFYEQDGKYYFIEHDNRGNELQFKVSKDEEEIYNRFMTYAPFEIKTGRPKR